MEQGGSTVVVTGSSTYKVSFKGMTLFEASSKVGMESSD